MSDSLFRFDSLSDILIALGNDSIADAKRILAMPIHHRVAAIKRTIAGDKRRAVRVAASKVRNVRRDFDSLVFPKATKRVSSSDADHTLRLSSGSSDSSLKSSQFIASSSSANGSADSNAFLFEVLFLVFILGRWGRRLR